MISVPYVCTLLENNYVQDLRRTCIGRVMKAVMMVKMLFTRSSCPYPRLTWSSVPETVSDQSQSSNRAENPLSQIWQLSNKKLTWLHADIHLNTDPHDSLREAPQLPYSRFNIVSMSLGVLLEWRTIPRDERHQRQFLEQFEDSLRITEDACTAYSDKQYEFPSNKC